MQRKVATSAIPPANILQGVSGSLCYYYILLIYATYFYILL